MPSLSHPERIRRRTSSSLRPPNDLPTCLIGDFSHKRRRAEGNAEVPAGHTGSGGDKDQLFRFCQRDSPSGGLERERAGGYLHP